MSSQTLKNLLSSLRGITKPFLMMTPSTSNRHLYEIDRYFRVHSQAYPGYKGIDCACLRIHKHPHSTAQVYNLTSDRFWPNLAIVKNSRLPRYRSPATMLLGDFLQIKVSGRFFCLKLSLNVPYQTLFRKLK